MANILFLGTHGQKNWGDELLLNVFMHQLSPYVNHVYVNSYDVQETATSLKKYSVTVYDTRTDRIRLLRYLHECDALVFGGGSIIKELNEDYGGKRYSTLNTINLLTKAAVLMRKPIYFANIGVGPIESKRGLGIAEKILKRSTHTSLRDSISSDILNKTRLQNFTLSTDAVFSVKPSFFELKKTNDTLGTRIGINLCRNIDNNDNWGYFFSTLKKNLVSYARANPDTKFVGIPMQSDVKTNDDYKTIKKLETEIKKELPSIKFTTVKTRSISHMANLINSCDLLIAERLHALITSVIANTPIIALAYNPKVLAIISDIGLKKYCIDINRRFPDNIIIDTIDECILNKEIHTELSKTYQRQHAIATKGFHELSQAIIDKHN